MSITLLVESEKEISTYYCINLKAWVGTKCVVLPSAKEAIIYLQENENVDLVISKSKNNKENSAEAIDTYLQSTGRNTPFIVIGPSSLDQDNIIHLASFLEVKPLVQTAAKALGVTAQDMATLAVPDYFSIPAEFFYFLHGPIADVYYQESPEIFIKKFDAGEILNQSELQAFLGNHIDELFVKKADRLKFVSYISQELAGKMDLSSLAESDRLRAVEISMPLLSQNLKKFGITEETVKLSNRNMKQMMQSAKGSTDLIRMLKRFGKDKASYLFKHSQLLMYLGQHVLGELDWGTPEQTQKFQFIAFFHDIVLENDEQAMIHSQEQLKESSLTPDEVELVKTHAQASAEIILKHPKAPMAADIIIRQHHGIPHGVGFTTTYGANLSPMTIVFILSEDFADTICRLGFDFDIKVKIKEMRERYSTQRFQKIIDALEKVVV